MQKKSFIFFFLIFSFFFCWGEAASNKGVNVTSAAESLSADTDLYGTAPADSPISVNENKSGTTSWPAFFGKKFSPPKDFGEFLASVDFTFELAPALMINTASIFDSAPSPIVYPIGIGFRWPNYTLISFQPRLSFFWNDYLLFENRALPAEIENRTATAFSFMVNLPAAMNIYLFKSQFELTFGLSTLLRFGIRSVGVLDSDTSVTESISSDVAEINRYFWSNARFLYLSTGFSWQFYLPAKCTAGPNINIYMPMGSFFSGEGVQGMIISLGLRIIF